jgi:hypothetical protein
MKPQYVASMKNGDRVRFVGTDNASKTGQECTIVRVLPNPSEKQEHQWYDVQFDDGTLGRYLERCITDRTSKIPLNDVA